jgi:hypothetical protein
MLKQLTDRYIIKIIKKNDNPFLIEFSIISFTIKSFEINIFFHVVKDIYAPINI